MLIIGLTGGIGSGKSTVARQFEAHGVPIIDTDCIARELVAPGQPALRDIVQRFGAAMLDQQGRLDRARLRQYVFAHAAERRALEAILHPRIRTETLRRVVELDAPYCIICIPLLIESGWNDLVDRILVIDCPPELQLTRVMARDHLSRTEAEAILASQVDRDTRLRHAHDVIHNDQDLAQLAAQVETLHRHYLALSRG
jgi:dephospho-CoA kinase